MPDNALLAAREPIRASAIVYPRPVGKKLELMANGETVRKEALLEIRAHDGRVQNLEFATAKEAFEFRLQAEPTLMFLSGTFDETSAHAVAVPEWRRSAADESNVAATKEFLQFREQPGLISIDVDAKDPSEVAAIHPEGGGIALRTPEEVLGALNEILPEAEGCPVLIMPSSSSMIERTIDGELVRGPGGWRIWLATSDASQTPRILHAIHTRCWAKMSWAYAFVSKGGRVLDRSLADMAMARPTQPDYPTAVLGEGLRKTPDAYLIQHVGANLFDPASVALSPEDQREARKNLDVARCALKPATQRAASARKRAFVQGLVDRGVPQARADRAATLKLEHGVLLGSDVVEFADGEIVQVNNLLGADGERYDGKICLDPVESDYDGGRPVGIFYWNNGGAPGIHSFAHGSRFFKLRHDEPGAIAAIKAADGRKEEIVRIVALSELSDVEERLVEGKACGALGLGNNRLALRAEVKEEKERLFNVDRGLETEKKRGGV